jgi:hypothetical protein
VTAASQNFDDVVDNIQAADDQDNINNNNINSSNINVIFMINSSSKNNINIS